jgi:hypothetical protein
MFYIKLSLNKYKHTLIKLNTTYTLQWQKQHLLQALQGKTVRT